MAFQQFAEGYGQVDSKPSPRALADLLRHPERWPEGFEFDFRSCNTCAMKLVQLTWGSRSLTAQDTARRIGITERQAIDIFICRGMKMNSAEAIARDLEAIS